MTDEFASADVVFLLGAGASREADLPVATEMTQLMLAAVQHTPEGRINAHPLNYVVSAILAHRGRAGKSPLHYPDIETVASAVELLAARDDVELTPFVQSWDPGVGAAETSASQQQQLAQKISDDLANIGALGLGSADLARDLGAFVRAEVGLAPGRTYAQLSDFLVGKLVNILAIDDDRKKKLGYLAPLVRLGSRRGGVSIATLNYDRTIETCAEQHSVPCTTGVGEWDSTGNLAFPADAVRLYKLHGSIDWARTGEDFDDAYNRQTGQNSPMGMKRVALRPSAPMGKELPFVVFGRREKLRADGPFLDLRAAFADRLSSARVLVVVGYSFGDEHVNALVAHWLNVNDARRLVVIDPYFPTERRPDSRGDMRQTLIRQLVRTNGSVPPNSAPELVATRLSVVRRGAAESLSEICLLSGDALLARPYVE